MMFVTESAAPVSYVRSRPVLEEKMDAAVGNGTVCFASTICFANDAKIFLVKNGAGDIENARRILIAHNSRL